MFLISLNLPDNNHFLKCFAVIAVKGLGMRFSQFCLGRSHSITVDKDKREIQHIQTNKKL